MPETTTASLDAIDTSVEAMVTTPKTRRSMPDSVAPSPVSGKRHLRETIRAHPDWTAYSIVHVKSMAPPINQPIIPTGNAGSSNRSASQMPIIRRKGRKAMTMMRSPDHRTQGDRSSFPPSQNGKHDIRYPHPQDGNASARSGTSTRWSQLPQSSTHGLPA